MQSVSSLVFLHAKSSSKEKGITEARGSPFILSTFARSSLALLIRILKMLALPVSRYALSAAKFCILLFYLLLEMIVFLVVFIIAGLIATSSTGITETLPIVYLLKWCAGLFLTMLPSVAAMWAITILFDKPLLSVGLNLFLVIPGVLVANTPLWIVYPYCYSGYLVSCSLHDFSTTGGSTGFELFPFLPCAIVIFAFIFGVAVTRFGKKEMR